MTDLKAELESLAVELVKKAKATLAGNDFSPEAVEVFKVVGTWELGNRKVSGKTDAPPEETFADMRKRINQPMRGTA